MVGATVIVAGSLWLSSCQSDARTATRIPPAPTEKTKANWEKVAIEALSANIRRQVDTDVNYFKRARIYFNQEEYEKALSDINDAIAKKDNVGEYYLLRGQIQRELNRLDPALEDAQRAEALQQDSPELYILLADILQEKKRFRDAQRYLNRSLQMAPYHGTAYYVKGMLQSRMGDSTASISIFDEALNLNPRLLRAYQQNIIIHNRRGNYPRALHYNNLALARFPEDAELHYERALIYNASFKSDSALLSYAKAVALDPGMTRAYYESGTIYLKWKMYSQAARAFEKVKQNQPAFPEINYLIGQSYERLGNLTKAIEYYNLELEVNPSSQPATAGLWRVDRRPVEPFYIPSEPRPAAVVRKGTGRVLDTTRIKINPIQPRRTIQMGSDSTRTIQIK
jgi:tetratricopeptide (TPR) repeat protein